ncbi:hypothetical protein NW768_010994 [Fusarium equiseti]|uniref:Uncharacterized protein n=1 Tax=Fusarium equiseti TaxID=61235 RepID=A0ABQ8QYL1_FUSEQ|nr:hypothetical protein NW768_010994 [Fusarium equiseti]
MSAQQQHLLPSPSAHRLLTGSGKHCMQNTQIWTAARCQRLLRQLQCRLVSLRKLVDEARRPQTAQTKRPRADEEFTKRPKRIRYTYAKRRSVLAPEKSTTSSTLTPPRALRTLGSMKIKHSPSGVGRIDFTTPVLCSFDQQDPTFESTSKDPVLKANSPTSLAAGLQSLRRIVPDNQYRICEIIFGWLSGLLSSTESLGQTAHPKSLLGLCLRKVPDAVAVIEEWDRQTAAKEGKSSKWESSKASTELYEQLEGFGTASIGWKSLKLVVRAHALCLLTAAVAEGLFEPSFVRLLADLCLSLGCRAEGARLVSSLKLPLSAPRGSASTLFEGGSIQPLGAILRSLQGQGTSGPSWCCLSTLIRNKKLSLTWLTSRAFQPVWMRGIEVLLHSRTPVVSVIDFICTAINQLLMGNAKETESEEASEDETLMNALAAMAAATWTLGAELSVNEPWKVQAVRRMLFTLETCVLQQQSRRGAFRSRGLFLVVLARFIAAAMIDSDVVSSTTKKRAIHDCLRLLTVRNSTPTQPQYRQTLLLACSIAQYRGQACGLPCHDILFKIRVSLNELGLPDWFQIGLVSDGAFLLAQKTRDLRDVAFAERLSAAGKGTLEISTMFSGWRWEEGIGEWVLSSPHQERRNEPRQQYRHRNGTGCQTGEDRLSDSRVQTGSPLRRTRAGYDHTFRHGIHENNSSGCDKGSGGDDDTDDTDNEVGNDTSATSITDDGVVREDSGDELGGDDHLAHIPAISQQHSYSVCKRNESSNSNSVNTSTSTSTTTKTIRKVKRLDITRTWQTTRLDQVGLGETRQVAGDTDDELSMLY